MDGKVRYLVNGKVMEADAVEVARWYMECLRTGNFRPSPPGSPAVTGKVDFDQPLDEYDDAAYFLHDLLDNYMVAEVRKELRKEIRAFLR